MRKWVMSMQQAINEHLLKKGSMKVLPEEEMTAA